MEALKIIKEAILSIAELKNVLMRALVIHLAVLLVIDAAYYLDISKVGEALLSMADAAICILVAITTHRVLLLGPSSVPGYGIISISKRELKYFMSAIGIGLLFIPTFIFAYIPIIGVVICLVLFVWLAGRLSVVFPAVALDKDFSFKDAWELTSGFDFPMLLIVGAYPIILAAPLELLYKIPFGFFIGSFFYLVTVVLTVASLSMAYKYLSEKALTHQASGAPKSGAPS